MPQYAYSAVDKAGNKQSGFLEVSDKSQLVEALKEKNLYIMSAQAVEELTSKEQAAKNRKVKLKPLAIFCRQFATLINSGITAIKALDILYQQTADKQLKVYMGRIYESVQKGEVLSEAFRKQGEAFPELFINMIMSGEGSGNLDQVLIRLADHYEKENKMRNRIKSAMIYPSVLAGLTVVVVILMMVVVLPTFIGIIETGGGEIPAITKVLIAISTFLQRFWWLVIGVVLLLVVSWRGFKRSESGALWWDSVKLRLPIVGKSIRMIIAARFARTLATLISSGIQMLQSIEITSRVVNNRLVHDKLILVVEDIRKGVSLSVAIKRTEQFPAMIYNMINVGEESGMLDDILTKTAAFFDEESDSAVNRLVGLLEPLMIIIMAIIIGFIVIAIALPMFTMYGTIA